MKLLVHSEDPGPRTCCGTRISRPKIQVLPNLDINCETSSAGEPKMGTILRQGGQVNNALIIFESKYGSHPTGTCSSAPRSPVVGHCGTVDHDPNMSLRHRLRHITWFS